MENKTQPATPPPEGTWDSIVESALHRALSTSSPQKPFGVATLKLSPEAKPTILPNRRRYVDRISQPLRDVIRHLVSGKSPWPLYLTGAAGGGKTSAALCLLDHAGGFYWTASELCRQLIECQQGRATWSFEGRSGSLTVPAFWRQQGSASLVVLDEIGARDRATDHHYECVKDLIDCREQKPFVVIGNLSFEAVAKIYDDRIVSRLAAGTVFSLTGDDLRLKSERI